MLEIEIMNKSTNAAIYDRFENNILENCCR